MVKKRKSKNKTKYIILGISIFLIAYLVTGFIFTKLRSNAHYEYFVEGSYWEERCKEENNYPAFIDGTPGARWCIVNGEFMTTTPTKADWYRSFYFSNKLGYNGGFGSVMLFWWTHFLGNDMINFRSMGGIFG